MRGLRGVEQPPLAVRRSAGAAWTLALRCWTDGFGAVRADAYVGVCVRARCDRAFFRDGVSSFVTEPLFGRDGVSSFVTDPFFGLGSLEFPDELEDPSDRRMYCIPCWKAYALG